MAIALTVQENTLCLEEFAAFATQSTMLTDMARREARAAVPDVAGFNTAYQALVATMITALYGQAAPTIGP